MTSHDCIFCKIISGAIPANIIEQTDDIIVIQDIAPKAPVHLLLIPKKHVKDIQSMERTDCCLGSKMMLMAQKLSKQIPEAEHFKFLINSGHNAGQRVYHLHAHFLAGAELSEL